MKKNKIKNIIICLFVVLLIIIVVFLLLIKNIENPNNTNEINTNVPKEPSTIKEAIEKNNSKYIDRENNDIYVEFGKDLYDENGNSNEKYFDAIIEDLKPFFKYSFTLIDEEKNIIINVDIQDDTKIINNNEKFYEDTDGKTYVDIENVEIAERTYMHINSNELSNLAYEGMFFTKNVEEKFGEKDEMQYSEDYTTYQNSSIRVSKYKYSNRIRNIIFSREYETDIMSGISQDDSLEEIENKKPTVAFGSVKKGYLGYRTDDVYIFYYKDEVSVYGYSYVENTKLENYIEEYLNTKDLSTFYKVMVVTYDNFYNYNYDEANQNLYLSYPSLGLEIDIKNNNPEITLYNNYYFTDKTKQWVKDGVIKLEADTDYIEKVELERVSK